MPQYPSWQSKFHACLFLSWQDKLTRQKSLHLKAGLYVVEDPAHRPRVSCSCLSAALARRSHGTAEEAALPRSRAAGRRARQRSGRQDDARREGLADAEPRRRHPASRRARVQLVERGTARHRALRLRHRLPAGRRPGRHLGRFPDARSGNDHLYRDARQTLRGAPPQQPQHLLRARPLGPEHQHLPRPALGTRPGDLRRRPLSDLADGRRLRQGATGR